MLYALARQTGPHQMCRTLGNNDLLVRRDVVTVRVGNERKRLCVPGVQPKILLRQVNTALVTNFNHPENYFAICVSSMVGVVPASTAGSALHRLQGPALLWK